MAAGPTTEQHDAFNILEGHLTLQAPHKYALLLPFSNDADDGADGGRSQVTGTGLLDLGHCIHRHVVKARRCGGGALSLVSDQGFPRFEFVTTFDAATRTHTAKGGWSYQRYSLVLVPTERFVPSSDARYHAAQVTFVADRMERELMQANASASVEERAALELGAVPWSVRRRLPMHYVVMLWARARGTDGDATKSTLGRLNGDVLQNALEFLNGAPFRSIVGRNTWGGGGGPAPAIHFVEHTGPYTTDVHCRLMCGGAYVRKASLEYKKTPVERTAALRWAFDDNRDSLRETKPGMADITFSGSASDPFREGRGQMQFPGEGPIGYVLAPPRQPPAPRKY